MSRGVRVDALNAISTPTAWILLAASMVMAAGSLTANLLAFEVDELTARATLQQAMHASTVATLTFSLVAGLVSATSDYRFGRIDQLLLSEPSHRAVVAAKALVGAGVGVIYGLFGGIVAVAVLRVFYSVRDVPVDLTSTVVIEPLVGAVLASALFGMIGIGMGTAIRNQPAAVAGGLAMLLVVQPPMLIGLPEVGRWLPGAAGLSMTFNPDDALLGALQGGCVLVAWTALAVIAGWRRLVALGAG